MKANAARRRCSRSRDSGVEVCHIKLADQAADGSCVTNGSSLGFHDGIRLTLYRLKAPIFRAFRSKLVMHVVADSLVARRHFALSRFDFRSFRVSVGKMTPGRGGYQSTNLPYTNEQIPESYESLADSNVRGICFRGNPG